MRLSTRTVGIIAIAILAAACGGSATPTTQGGGGGGGGGGAVPSDPCTLLTQADVSTVVGQQVGAGTKDIDPNECDFQYPVNAVPTIQVSITIERGSTFASLCTGPGSSVLGITITQVPGVGDGACYTTMGGLGAGDNLVFTKGAGVYTIDSVLGPSATEDQKLAADKALALAAIGHLG